jgi:ribosomal protein S18 acetylase RimI-like enzyme
MVQTIPLKTSATLLPSSPEEYQHTIQGSAQHPRDLHKQVAATTPTSVVFISADIGQSPREIAPAYQGAVVLREYKPDDVPTLCTMVADCQDCLMALDPEQRMKREAGFGPAYVKLMLREIEEQCGTLLMCTIDERPVGFSASIMCPQSAYDELEYKPERIGRITELYVIREFRGNGIGAKLLCASEDVLRAKGCSRVELGVMPWNKGAHALYRKNGYAEKYVRMSKPL